MIISCEKCQTRFHLDDARVPPQGARVRCSRCKHTFLAVSPAASTGERIHAAAAEAAVSTAAPPPTRDLGAPDAPQSPRSTGPASAGDGEEDSDWQWNDDVPGLEAKAGDDPRDRPPDRGDFDFFEHPPVENPLAAARAAVSNLFERQEESEAPSLDALGSPDTWDLVGESTEETAAPPVPPRRAVEGAGGVRTSVEPRAPATPLAEIPPQRVIPRTPMRFVENVVGSLATAALLLALAHGALVRSPAEPAVGAASVGTFALEDLRGRFVENAYLGPLYVVSGRVRNEGDAAARPTLEIALLDERGRLLEVAGAAAGPPLPLEILREASRDHLREAVASQVAASADRPVEPGESVFVEAIFEEIPAEAARFTPVESRPTPRPSSE